MSGGESTDGAHGHPRQHGPTLRRAGVEERLHGAEPASRGEGLYHVHRHEGWQPHPHSHAARVRRQETPRVLGEGDTGVGSGRRPGGGRDPLHAYQHATSARHRDSARSTPPVTEVGQVAGYDPGSGQVVVRLAGAPARLVGPVTMTACVPRDARVVGAMCLVTLLDAYNPADGVVTALWAAPGSTVTPGDTALGAGMTQAGAVLVAVPGPQGIDGQATVAFAVPYDTTPVVVATSTDPAWTVAVAHLAASGFGVVIRGTSGGTAGGAQTVGVTWLAHGI